MTTRTPGTRGSLPRRGAAIGLLAAGLALLASPAEASGVELAYGYEPGQVYRTVIETDAEMRLISGEPETEAGLEPYRELRQKVTMTWEQRFSAAEPPPLLVFEATLTDLGVRLFLEGEEAQVPPELFHSLEGLTLGGKIGTKGGVSELRVRTGRGADDASMLEEIGALSPDLPEEALAPGESFRWERALTLSAPSGSGEPLEGAVTTTYTLKEVSGRLAHFELSSELGLAPGEAGEGIELRGQGEGEATFDLDQGFFVSSSLDLRLSRSLGGAAPVTLQGSTRLRSTTTARAE
jgi:hypothetical protein